MKLIYVIALNSLREYVRDKVVLIVGFIAVALFAFSLLLGALSFAEQQRILAHFGLAAIHLSCLAVVSFLGSFLLHKEIERQTCLLVLARPITRAQFLVGKFLGVFQLLFLFIFLLGAALEILLQFQFPFAHYVSVLFGIFMEMSLLLALAVFASTFLRSTLALFATVGSFFIGNWSQDLGFFGEKIKSPLYLILSKSLKIGFPNLFEMNWRSVYFLEKGVPGAQLGWVLLHGLGWTLFFLTVAVFIFRRKDLV
jgi:ABC-type transport system involved in multi-copper enzyme maturation permease subunit